MLCQVYKTGRAAYSYYYISITYSGTAMRLDRIQSVDVFRLVAISAVILAHTNPFSDKIFHEKSEWFIRIIINNSTRFAVPFFFVISGYFWGIKVRDGHPIDLISSKMIKRLLFIFLVWSFIYLFPFHDVGYIFQYGILGPIKLVYWNLSHLISSPLTLILQGTRGHLWFLTGLIFSISITSAFIKRDMFKPLAAIAIALYIFGILAKSYSHSPIGININFNTILGPFFGTIFFASGYHLSKYNPTDKWLFIGFYLLCVGISMHFIEIYLLWKLYGINPWGHDYVFGTYFMGLGVSIMALSNHNLLSSNKLANIGKLTLGIYLIHRIFVDLLLPTSHLLFSPAWEIAGYPIIVFCASIASVSFLSKYKYGKAVIS